MRYLFIILFVALFSCANDESLDEPTIQSTDGLEDFEINWTVRDAQASSKFQSPAEDRGFVNMEEASGIVLSKTNPGYLWSHNDSGNDNVIFLIDRQTGETVTRYRLRGIPNRDWEDIELGTDDKGDHYLYLAEFGDNNRRFSEYAIHKFKEPEFKEDHRGRLIPIDPENHTPIKYKYPNNLQHDAETLLYDPIFDDLYIVTKRDFRSIIYLMTDFNPAIDFQEPIRLGTFPFTRAVGGNVSFAGDEILIKTNEIIFHWKRDINLPLWHAFMQEPEIAPYDPLEPQGEAICFDELGGYYTLSEWDNNVRPHLYFYGRK
ncbi:MAG: hypothetical protein LAT68_00615 [Cyclobacteriaceae bacterium]|nr:hypothetical protein [Cyclobacteriaceae bacterium]MCH8514805.1 hypothetical protein [Cyclobacteriaceae bacterium]